MSQALKTLNDIRTLRAQAREIDLTTLEEMLEKFTAIVEDRRVQEAVLSKEQQEKQAKIEAFRQKLREDGIDPADLLSSPAFSASPKIKLGRASRPAKYKYVDVDGPEKTWTGQGRTPKAIAEAIANGRSLEEFEI